MRISTSMMYSNNIDTMMNLQTNVAKLSQEVTQGSVLTPSDDPIAAANALNTAQSQSVNTQFAKNRASATSALTPVSATLQNIVTSIGDVKAQAIAGGNGSYSDQDRANIATSLQGTYQELLGYANSTDGLGNYVFAGYQTSTQPFVDNGTAGVSYQGDQGVQTMQVDSTRTMDTSVPGSTVFQSSAGDVFQTINNLITALQTPISTTANNTEAAKSQAVYDTSYGTTITGLPTPTQAQIDAATAAATPAQLSSAQTTAQLAQSAYETDYTRTDFTPGSTGALNQALAQAGTQLTAEFDNVTTINTSVGSNLAEMQTLDAVGQSKDIQYSTTISTLMGTDPTSQTAIASSLVEQQGLLSAAQKVFASVSSLSLLNYLK
ncbi:MAG: flgL [Herbaspirillum sp.]|jgi:flagellar hook-associated protein 3 FlgL|nr:flgL [Herbaspirillum sp.]